jgi:hypothetical protein
LTLPHGKDAGQTPLFTTCVKFEWRQCEKNIGRSYCRGGVMPLTVVTKHHHQYKEDEP